MSEENHEEYLTVAQVCNLTDASPVQLKYWDKVGVLVAKRSGEYVANNRKLYTKEDVLKVQEILLYKHLGFELSEIKELLKSPKSQRDALVAERTRSLKEEYSQLHKKILLSSSMELLEPEMLICGASDLGGIDALEDEYAKDENIKMMTRWLRSHTERDAQYFTEEIYEQIRRFDELRGSYDWEEVELQIARFCDMWSKRFGWPSLGQMLGLFHTFHGIAMDADNDSDANKDILDFMSNAFYLAWVSASIECLDQILVCLYWDFVGQQDCDAKETATAQDALLRTGEVLCSFAQEASNNACVFNESARFIASTHDRMSKVAGALFDALEEAALDENIDDFLNLEVYVAINEGSLEFANSLLNAFIDDDLERWLEDSGYDQLERCISDWLDALQIEFDQIAPEASQTASSNLKSVDAGDIEDEFLNWIGIYYEDILADPPEATPASEEEQCADERRSRQRRENASGEEKNN